MYLHKVQCIYCAHFVLHTLLLVLRWDTGMVRDRFGGMGGFKGGLRSTM